MRRIKSRSFTLIKWSLFILAVIYFYLDYSQYHKSKLKSKDNTDQTASVGVDLKRDALEKDTINELVDKNVQKKKDTLESEGLDRKNNIRQQQKNKDTVESDDLDREQIVRKQHLQSYCETSKPYVTKTSPQKLVYLSKKYNFTLCQVPKIATTFLALAFGVIEYDNYDLQAKSRQIIQGETFQFSVLLDSEEAKEQRTIVISRDPYSRLFSAYIDKSYLPGTYYINKMMMNRKGRKLKIPSRCFDLDFQDFLEFIIKENSRGQILDQHWMPVTTSCRPCEFQPFLVLKQETFERDIWYALRNIGIEEQKLKGIDDLFKKWKHELSIPVLIKAINFTRDTQCFSWTDTAKRVWSALKMQGYIHTHEPFPIEKLKANNMIGNEDYLIEIVIETMKNRPLSSKERSQQRRQALTAAFKVVKPDTLKTIQQLYMQDFELFGYTLDVPS